MNIKIKYIYLDKIVLMRFEDDDYTYYTMYVHVFVSCACNYK